MSKVRLRLPIIDDLAEWFVRAIVGFTRRITQSNTLCVVMVATLCGAGAVSTVYFLPKKDYLPDGNRNLIFGILVPPPGYNLETTE